MLTRKAFAISLAKIVVEAIVLYGVFSLIASHCKSLLIVGLLCFGIVSLYPVLIIIEIEGAIKKQEKKPPKTNIEIGVLRRRNC